MSPEIQAGFEDHQQQLRTEGARHFMLRLLRARFGQLSPAALARVESAHMPDLERWADRVFLAHHTLADVLTDPR